MLRGEGDYNDYFQDTMRAGHFENDEKAVELMIRSSNSIIRDLVRRHVDFARDAQGNLALPEKVHIPSHVSCFMKMRPENRSLRLC